MTKPPPLFSFMQINDFTYFFITVADVAFSDVLNYLMEKCFLIERPRILVHYSLTFAYVPLDSIPDDFCKQVLEPWLQEWSRVRRGADTPVPYFKQPSDCATILCIPFSPQEYRDLRQYKEGTVSSNAVATPFKFKSV